MGRKKDYERALQQMMAQFQQAQQPSAFETQYQNEWNNLGSFLNSRDYRNLPAGVNVDLLPIAEYQKMRQMTRGANNGQAAKGANTNGLMAQQREMGDNQFVKDWGGQYESAIGDLSGRRDSIGNMLMSSDANRKQLGIQGAQANLQGILNKPKSMWSSLLPSLIQGGASIGASFI